MITRSIVSNNEEHLREKFRWPFIFCDCPTDEARYRSTSHIGTSWEFRLLLRITLHWPTSRYLSRSHAEFFPYFETFGQDEQNHPAKTSSFQNPTMRGNGRVHPPIFAGTEVCSHLPGVPLSLQNLSAVFPARRCSVMYGIARLLGQNNRSLDLLTEVGTQCERAVIVQLLV